jgi:hypothetical protein
MYRGGGERRRLLPGTSENSYFSTMFVNKGKKEGRGCLEPQSSGSRSLMRAPSCFGPRFLAESVEASDYLDPFVILIIQHDTCDELCAVRGTLSSEEPGDALGYAPKDALPPRSLCGLLSGVALGRRYFDCFFIYRRVWNQTELLAFPRDSVAEI